MRRGAAAVRVGGHRLEIGPIACGDRPLHRCGPAERAACVGVGEVEARQHEQRGRCGGGGDEGRRVQARALRPERSCGARRRRSRPSERAGPRGGLRAGARRASPAIKWNERESEQPVAPIAQSVLRQLPAHTAQAAVQPRLHETEAHPLLRRELRRLQPVEEPEPQHRLRSLGKRCEAFLEQLDLLRSNGELVGRQEARVEPSRARKVRRLHGARPPRGRPLTSPFDRSRVSSASVRADDVSNDHGDPRAALVLDRRQLTERLLLEGDEECVLGDVLRRRSVGRHAP